MKYRPEIDGLRAIAVVPVVFFHAGLPLFPGGYVGVDVFFVISGYLITSILLKDLEAGTYSVASFYERRARRILPPLTLVIVCCIPPGWLYMTPSEFKLFAESTGTIAIFLSNFLFLAEIDYFAQDAELQPLIHTWSLSIEEQFYLLFPFILYVSYRMGGVRAAAGAIALLLVSSFLLALKLLPYYPEKLFFFSPARFWELLVGCMIAISVRISPPTSRNALALTGLAAIFYSILQFDELTPSPSAWTLFPVIGTALLLRYGLAGSVAARILSVAPLVWLGLISYSIYLWHQPIFAFARLIGMQEPTFATRLGLIGLAIALAHLTWKFVETPFRSRTHAIYPSRRTVALVFSGFATVFFAFGVWGSMGKGLPWRLPERVQHLAAGGVPNPYLSACQFTDGPINHPVEGCTDFFINDGFDVMFIGDSHLGSTFNEFQKALKAEGVGSYAISMAGCVGLRGFYGVLEQGLGRCDSYSRDMIGYAREKGVRVVVILSRFTMAYHGIGYDNGEGGIERKRGRGNLYVGSGTEVSGTTEEARKSQVLIGYSHEIRALSADFRIVVVYPIPEAGWNVPAMLARRALVGISNAPLTTSLGGYQQRNRDVIEVFDRLVGARILPVRTEPIFCTAALQGRCLNELDGEPLYSDDDHLSDTGAGLLAPAVVDGIKAALAAGQ